MPWGVAAAAVGAAGTYLGAKEGNKQSQSEPEWLQRSEKNALGKAEDISNRAYVPYKGRRVAELSGNEATASNLARFGNDESRDLIRRGASQLEGIKDYSAENLQPYQNPYTEAVLKPQLRELNRNYGQQRSRLLNSKAGAFGGDRAALEESALERGHRESIADVTGKTMSDSFLNAQQAFFADNNRRIAASDAFARAGGNLADLNKSQIQDLMATGGLTRMLEQAQLDTKFSDFLEKRDWDINNLDPLLKAITASKGGNITTERNDGAGAWGQALGAAATIAGAYFTGGFGKKGVSTPSTTAGTAAADYSNMGSPTRAYA